MGRELVKLKIRPGRNGSRFTYTLDYLDEQGTRRRVSLGHADKKKAGRQRAEKERDLRAGVPEQNSVRLSSFIGDARSSRQEEPVRESTLVEHDAAMKEFIDTVGDLHVEDVKRKHASIFRDACLTKGNTLATARKKVGSVKHFLELAVQDEVLDANPFRQVRFKKSALKTPHIFTPDECDRLVEAAAASDGDLDWELLILLALCTAMRRGELLNLTWADVDLKRLTVQVSAKANTPQTWEWRIKDSEERRLPITKEVAEFFLSRCAERTMVCPYVFISSPRYAVIQGRRAQGKWTLKDGRCPVNNFGREFSVILKRAGVKVGKFHDFRRTALSRWFANGLTEYDVMSLAGHADFETTRRFYLAVREDLLDRARVAATAALPGNFGARLARAGVSG